LIAVRHVIGVTDELQFQLTTSLNKPSSCNKDEYPYSYK